jgi:hypothetical protein
VSLGPPAACSHLRGACADLRGFRSSWAAAAGRRRHSRSPGRRLTRRAGVSLGPPAACSHLRGAGANLRGFSVAGLLRLVEDDTAAVRTGGCHGARVCPLDHPQHVRTCGERGRIFEALGLAGLLRLVEDSRNPSFWFWRRRARSYAAWQAADSEKSLPDLVKICVGTINTMDCGAKTGVRQGSPGRAISPQAATRWHLMFRLYKKNQ